MDSVRAVTVSEKNQSFSRALPSSAAVEYTTTREKVASLPQDNRSGQRVSRTRSSPILFSNSMLQALVDPEMSVGVPAALSSHTFTSQALIAVVVSAMLYLQTESLFV